MLGKLDSFTICLQKCVLLLEPKQAVNSLCRLMKSDVGHVYARLSLTREDNATNISIRGGGWKW